MARIHFSVAAWKRTHDLEKGSCMMCLLVFCCGVTYVMVTFVPMSASVSRDTSHGLLVHDLLWSVVQCAKASLMTLFW